MKLFHVRGLLALLWMAAIFFGSSVPADSLPHGPQFLPLVAHLIEFFVLALVLMWLFNGGFSRPVLPSVAIAAAVLSFVYGVFDEMHQLFVPGRVSDFLDLAVDITGIVLALVLVPPLVAWRIRRLAGSGSINSSKEMG